LNRAYLAVCTLILAPETSSDYIHSAASGFAYLLEMVGLVLSPLAILAVNRTNLELVPCKINVYRPIKSKQGM
jgi:hypothetical protein